MKKIDFKFGFIKNKGTTFKKNRFSPNRAWKIMKLCFFFAFVLIITFGVVMFIAVDRGFLSKHDSTVDSFTTEINFSGIEKINEIIEKKNSNFEYFKSPNTEVVDPYQN